MSLFPIAVDYENVTYHFQVSEYPHYDELRCKFNVYYCGELVATFTPGKDHILHLCKKFGNIKDQLLDLVTDQIERLHPYGFFLQ